MKDPYDIDTVYDGRGMTLGFVWRRYGGSRWGALLSPRRLRCGQHCEQGRLGAFPDRAAALAAVVANLKPDARGHPQ